MMNIALSMNSAYVMPSLVCMVSILECNKGPITFYVLYSRLTQSEIDFMASHIKKYGGDHSLIPIKIGDDVFADSPAPGRSKEAYFRLLIPRVLPANVDRCLYLDSDIIVQGDLAPLYASSFEGKALVVCQDMGEFLFYHNERHELLGIPPGRPYFNSGVLLFNLEYFRTSFDVKIFFDYVKANPEKLKFLDQDVLNALMYDKVTFADAGLYDYMEILVNPALSGDALARAVIIHFLKKPWKYSYDGANSRLWWKYAKKIYPLQYYKFRVANCLYRTVVGLMLLIVSRETLKKIKKMA